MPTSRPFSADAMRWLSLLVATGLISVLFMQMILGFLVPLTLAAIAGSMAQPLNRHMVARLGGRTRLASAVTLTLMFLLVILPLTGIVLLAVSQAEALAHGVGTLAGKLTAADWKIPLPDWLPFDGDLQALWPKILEKLGDLVQAAAGFFVSSVSLMTLGAAAFFLHLFVFFYSLYFFLQMDTPILVQLLRFSGLAAETQDRLNERIMSVSRATIKGTLTIAFIQGALGGLSFWLAGVPEAAFWSVVMMVMAVLPALGAPAVLFGGSIYLAAKGDYFAAVAIAVWAAAVVSTIDNLLRPALVGRDARLHDVVILISTLGGLAMFGAAGLILGPVLAGLFVTIWTTLAETVAATGTGAGAETAPAGPDPGRPAAGEGPP